MVFVVFEVEIRHKGFVKIELGVVRGMEENRQEEGGEFLYTSDHSGTPTLAG